MDPIPVQTTRLWRLSASPCALAARQPPWALLAPRLPIPPDRGDSPAPASLSAPPGGPPVDLSAALPPACRCVVAYHWVVALLVLLLSSI